MRSGTLLKVGAALCWPCAGRRRSRCALPQMGAHGRCAHPRSACPERGPDPQPDAPDLRAAAHPRRERQGAAHARAVVGGDVRPHGLGVQAAPGRQVPQRQSLHCGRCRVLAGPRAAADLGHERAAELDREGEQGRRLHGAHQDQGAEPAAAQLPHQHVHDGQGVVRGEQHHHRPGLQGQEGQLRGPQRQRHGALRARVARAGRQDRAQAQRRLLGQGRVSGRHYRHHLSHDQGRRHADRGAAVGRGRFRAGRARAGHRPGGEDREHQDQPGSGEPHDLFWDGCRLAGTADLQHQGQEPVCGQARPAGDQHGHRPRGDQAGRHARAIGAGRRHRAAVRQRLHQGTRRSAQGGPCQGHRAAQGGRLCGRLPGHAALPQRPLHQ